ncbi:MAG TPA: hypothetical protein VNN80_34720, partial [Polyangiaceae bacterium]|nr:hypothetical protein [Polyangiaceae bacterium]
MMRSTVILTAAWAAVAIVSSGCRTDRHYGNADDGADDGGYAGKGNSGNVGGSAGGDGEVDQGELGGSGGVGGDGQGDDGGNDGDQGGAGGSGGVGGDGQGDDGGEYEGTGGVGGDGGAALEVFAGPTKGSAAALAPDGLVGAVVNRDVGSVTILALDADSEDEPPTLSVIEEIDLGKASEPWQVTIGPDGESAYVVLRQTQELVRIDDLYGEPHIGGRVAVGSEPTGLALSPTGRVAYVANWNDGTVRALSTDELELLHTFDLNAALVKTGYLGEVDARPALAHPRSIAITNDGDYDDGDEYLYVTEYFGQQTEEIDADGANADELKVGLVYAIDLESS